MFFYSTLYSLSLSLSLHSPLSLSFLISQIHKAGVANSTDFLDTVAEEEPKGCWVLQSSRSGEKVTLRSLAWPGFEFVADVNGRTYQRAYFGSGELNADLAFML